MVGPANPHGLRLQSFRSETPDGLEARWQSTETFEGFPGLVAAGVIATLMECQVSFYSTAPRVGPRNCLSRVRAGVSHHAVFWWCWSCSRSGRSSRPRRVSSLRCPVALASLVALSRSVLLPSHPRTHLERRWRR